MTARLTEDSLRTHGVLTHLLTEDSRLEVEGKGDRKWKGVRAEAFHHDYRKVDARDSVPVVAPSPVTTPDAMMSLTAIEHLDFTPTCDAQTALAACTRPAWALVGHLCHTCRTGRSWICRPCWDDTRTGWACAHCGLVMDARYMLIVAVL
jgi:hypothetical protein